MELQQAGSLARDLMTKYSLGNWWFSWHNKKNSFGTCHYEKRTIYLSKFLTPHLTESQIKNTVLHEIAHALVGYGHGHNHVWRNKAIEIGCDGKTKSNYDVDTKVKAKYSATCKGCGETHVFHRKPKRNYWCWCQGSKRKAEMQLNFVQQY